MNRACVSLFGQAVRLTIGLAVGLGVAVEASAQWLPDRQYSEGPGIRVGELELHPGIAVRGGYDTNVFRSDGTTRTIENPSDPAGGGTVTQKIQPAAVLAVTPHIYLTTETNQRAKEGEDRPARTPRFIGFRGGASASYLHYFVENGPRNVAVDTDFFLGVAQGRPVEFDVAASYLRSVTPFTENAGSRNAYAYDTVDGKLRLKFNSHSQVLTGFVGYAPRYVHYESSLYSYLNNFQNGAEVGASWRFLPSTALIYDAGFNNLDYTRDEAANTSTLLLSNSNIFRNRLGVNGALTNSITLRVMAGYAVGFIDHGALDDFEDAIGEAVLVYRFFAHSFELGYQRDVQPSALGAWMQTDRGYGRLSFLFARRFGLGFEVGAAHANYGRLIGRDTDGDLVGLGVGGETHREDIRVDGAVRAEYRATNWLSFMADFTAQSVITDFEYDQNLADATTIPDPADYTVFQIYGGVRAHY